MLFLLFHNFVGMPLVWRLMVSPLVLAVRLGALLCTVAFSTDITSTHLAWYWLLVS